jgi:protein-disulfide isomerase
MTRTFSMALAATAIALTPACAQEQIDTASREAIEKVVYDYIIENPEIIEEALIALTEKRQLEEDERTRTLISEKYDNQVRVVFKELPILSTESEKAALAAIAAGKQGKYVEMHMGLMELDNGSGFGPDMIDQVAESVGVDVAKMRADMKSVEVQKTVADSKSLARTLGITGTPNFVIGTEFVPSADITQVEALIQTALADS